MVRILQVVNKMDRAGLETMLMNYYRHMDHQQVQFDFLTHRPEDGAYDAEITAMGGKIYHAPRLYPQHYPAYFRYMRDFWASHPEYRVVHSHIDSMSAFPLLSAKRAGVPVRIAHSHSTRLDKDLKLPIKFAALKMVPRMANLNCACGHAAGRFMFPKGNFRVVPNAVDLLRFSFDEQIRQQVRCELRLDNAPDCAEAPLVIGHVGRYCYIKNQLFLLVAFNRILKARPNSYLLLVGKGEDEQKLRERIRALGLGERVRLLIDRDDVDRLYSAMDIFVMPSLFEGLPVVAVEAQANGLPCIVSDQISDEVLLTDSIRMLSLTEGAEAWADAVLQMDCHRNPLAAQQLREKGYDIRLEAQKLQQWYLQLYRDEALETTR